MNDDPRDPLKDSYIIMYDGNGKPLIDSRTATQLDKVSFNFTEKPKQKEN